MRTGRYLLLPREDLRVDARCLAAGGGRRGRLRHRLAVGGDFADVVRELLAILRPVDEFDAGWARLLPADRDVGRLADVGRIFLAVKLVDVPRIDRRALGVDPGPVGGNQTPTGVRDLARGFAR